LDPVYYCLDCGRSRLAALILDGDDLQEVTAESVPDDGINYGCGVCGKSLPESKKRELKAENLLLRAKLDVAERRAATSRAALHATHDRPDRFYTLNYASGGVVENGIPGYD